jgi:hypothetical protein
MISKLCKELCLFLFPVSCVHCQKKGESAFEILCQTCRSHVELEKEEKTFCFNAHSPFFSYYFHLKSIDAKKHTLDVICYLVIKVLSERFSKVDYILPGVEKSLKKNRFFLNVVKQVAKQIDIKICDPFDFKLADRVYDKKGRLLGSLFLKKKSIALKGKRILVVFEREEFSKQEYEQALKVMDVEQVEILSLFK